MKKVNLFTSPVALGNTATGLHSMIELSLLSLNVSALHGTVIVGIVTIR